MEAQNATCVAGASAPCRFENDDGCGDLILSYGLASQVQLFNALSALGFAAAGSASYHSTSGNTGFLMDIVPMAVSGAMLLHAAIHVLQLHFSQHGETARFAISAGAAAFAVWVPWAMMEAGVPAPSVWAVWAFLFGSLGAIFGVVALLIFTEYADPSGAAFRNVGQAVAFILFGLLCTVHSFVPGLCSGVLATLPFHALWHSFSAVSAYKTGRVLDSVLRLTEALERSSAEKQRKSSRSLCPLLVRMVKDALPSQFSM